MDGRPASFDVVMYLGLEDGRKLPVGLSADEARQLSVALYEAALGAGGSADERQAAGLVDAFNAEVRLGQRVRYCASANPERDKLSG